MTNLDKHGVVENHLRGGQRPVPTLKVMTLLSIGLILYLDIGVSGLRFQPSPSCHLSPQIISGQWKLLFVFFEFNFAPLTIPLFQAIALLLLSHLGLSFLDWNLILVENLHVSCFFSDCTHAAVSPHKLGIRTRQVSAQI